MVRTQSSNHAPDGLLADAMLRHRKPAGRSRRWREVSDQEVGRPHFRFANPYQEGDLEFLVQAIYDYWETAVNTATVAQILFSIQQGGSYTPTGGAAFNKKLYHTNLKQAGMLSAPQKHLVKGINITVRDDVALADIIAFAGQVQCQFQVGDGGKSYFDGMVRECPAGSGTSGAVSTTATTTTVAAWTNGLPYQKNIYLVAIDDNDGVGIEQGQAIAFTLDPTQVASGAFTTAASGSGGTGVKAHVKLQGILARGVQ